MLLETEATWYYYYLTGDERAREIGLRAAESIVERQAWGNENVGCRMAYQRGSAVLEAWKSTRDERYLNHARYLLINKILDTQDMFGLIGGSYEEGGFTIGPEQTFMMALYSDTVWKLLKEDPDPAAIARLARLADYMDQYARKAPGQEEYWNYNSAPDDTRPPEPYQDPNDPDASVYWFGKGLMAGTYAYAYDLTGEARYRTLAENLLNNLRSNVDFNESELWGKAPSQAMKNVLHAVAIVGPPTQGTSADDLGETVLPYRATLHQNYPNPFNPSTEIRFDQAVAGYVRLTVFDLLGRQVTALIDGPLGAGRHRVTFDAGRLPSGVYLYRIEAEGFVQARRMIVAK